MEKKYPQWLFTILQNDYGDDDNYWYDLDTDDAAFKEAYLKLKSLKRKYSDYNNWRAACNVYDDYIDIIIEHNGGEYAIASMFKADIIPDGWVPRPKLKSKKSNKNMMHTGLTPSKITYDKNDIRVINELAQEELPLTDAIRESIPDKIAKPKGYVKDAIDKALDVSAAKERVARMYTSRDAFDVLATYYKEEQYKDDTDSGNMSIRALFDQAVNDMYNKEHDDGWSTPDTTRDRQYEFRSYAIYSTSDRKQLDIEKEIFENNGIMTFDITQMPKDKVRLYRSEFGIEFDPKKRKKIEKDMKKYEKERKKREESNLNLSKALTRNYNGELNLDDESFTLNDFRRMYKK